MGFAMAAGGVALLGVGCSAGQTAPLTPPSASPVVAVGTPSGSLPSSMGPSSSPQIRPAAALARSVPMSLRIPALGVNTSVMRLGLNADGTIGVPPIEANSPAGWYQYSPTPGQTGPAVILGHVTVGRFGTGVFFKLGTLHTGDQIDVARADGTVAVFSVTDVATYSKATFPSAQVYGNLPYPGLRLITCGGVLNQQTDSYPDNIVVYAELVSSHAGA